ncbi:MAG: ABC transporter ATP-binding protein [Cyanobacteria bacterium K_Offshore_surface_m2_239]|nr:ABC transporter ATP-binding protein [Cyanobacteria bacterium K_Offshore_surface_m2_239]
MIKVNNLTKSFYYQGIKTTIFKDLSFNINTGESIAILGANGAGKSTLLRILGGIDLPDSGTIETDRTISWPVGLVGGFQGSLTGRENVTFVSRIYAEKRNVPEKVRYVEEFAELGVYFDRPFKTYSSGMRSRVAFGLSMAFDFDVYLIDEVTAAGDQRFREKSKRVLQDRKNKSDFLMVDHNLWGLKLHCDRAFILDGGKIEEFSDLDEAVAVHTDRLLSAPANQHAEQ